MKALVYGGPGIRTWTDVPDPVIQQPTDVIVRIDSSTICGTDLHILKGDVPETTPGTILGHEAVGTIVELGEAVTTLAGIAAKASTGSASAAVAGSSAT
jgi:alcohol dehydrogenase